MTVFNLRVGSATDVGRLRKINQDAVVIEGGIFGVADGMGGHQGGEVASAVAVEVLARGMREATPAGFEAAVKAANLAVYDQGQARDDLAGMGTTVVAVAEVELDDEPHMVLVNVGDSRGYLLRDHNLVQITEDHSLVADLVRAGRITPEEAENHPRRNIVTRVLGLDSDVRVDQFAVLPFEGDRFLMCSDGLTNEVSESQIAAVLRRIDDPDEAASELVRLANEGGGRDNISIVIVDVLDDDGQSVRASIAIEDDVSGLVARDDLDELAEAARDEPDDGDDRPKVAAEPVTDHLGALGAVAGADSIGGEAAADTGTDQATDRADPAEPTDGSTDPTEETLSWRERRRQDREAQAEAASEVEPAVDAPTPGLDTAPAVTAAPEREPDEPDDGATDLADETDAAGIDADDHETDAGEPTDHQRPPDGDRADAESESESEPESEPEPEPEPDDSDLADISTAIDIDAPADAAPPEPDVRDAAPPHQGPNIWASRVADATPATIDESGRDEPPTDPLDDLGAEARQFDSTADADDQPTPTADEATDDPNADATPDLADETVDSDSDDGSSPAESEEQATPELSTDDRDEPDLFLSRRERKKHDKEVAKRAKARAAVRAANSTSADDSGDRAPVDRAGTSRKDRKAAKTNEPLEVDDLAGFGLALDDEQLAVADKPIVVEEDLDDLIPSRRAFSWRVAGFLFACFAVVGIALGALGVYARGTYFVGFDGDRVAVFQGRPGGVLIFDPTLEAHANVVSSDLLSVAAQQVKGEPDFATFAEADAFIKNLQLVIQDKVPTTSEPGAFDGLDTPTSSTTTVDQPGDQPGDAPVPSETPDADFTTTTG